MQLFIYCLLNFEIGAEGRTRTGMVSLPLDFESSASANFTTSATTFFIIQYRFTKSNIKF